MEFIIVGEPYHKPGNKIVRLNLHVRLTTLIAASHVLVVDLFKCTVL
jgi:hypothetical protein